jgi:hypothetical protein
LQLCAQLKHDAEHIENIPVLTDAPFANSAVVNAEDDRALAAGFAAEQFVLPNRLGFQIDGYQITLCQYMRNRIGTPSFFLRECFIMGKGRVSLLHDQIHAKLPDRSKV